MFTSIIKEILGTKKPNVMKYSLTLIDDEYEGSNIASQKELGSTSGKITLGIAIYQLLNKFWTSLSLTQ